ncbi:MAG TPA: hypothetical protein VFV71_01930 [Burkholderiales bacterium]|nr:hypothetical protein [Burkholderiales bacterium]
MKPGALVRLVAATAALAAAAPEARADEGMVIWRSYDCGYFVLQMKGGYGLYEWLSGPYPNDGDIIEGELKSAGQHRVNNKTADLPTTVFQEAFARKRDAISARIPAKCKDGPQEAPAPK